jgi:hypothetical protein
LVLLLRELLQQQNPLCRPSRPSERSFLHIRMLGQHPSSAAQVISALLQWLEVLQRVPGLVAEPMVLSDFERFVHLVSLLDKLCCL